MGKQQRWQHQIPQDMAETHEEEVRPRNLRSAKLLCASCGQPIVAVDEDEGPEGLKALLRF